jgi:hypothetical protein
MPYENTTGLPSVSEILSPYINTAWFTKEHTDRGEAVHAAIAAYLQGLWVKPLKPNWQPYFDSFKRWADATVEEVVLVEDRLVDHGLGFCGQPDSILKLKGDDCYALADWKTSQGFQDWWVLQGCAYRHLAKKDKGIETKKQMSVILKKDGSGCLVKPYDNFRYYFNIFIGLLNAHRFFNGG